ncbi:DUF317 domain-containing protein [Streptomyces sp. NPDC051561]|uniref:DUF317 domain-containing protein n=1 Tax=Streptomyces sp. NPDC051561 TaxID=3365658 RepID=UPI0037B4ADC8
MWVSPRYLAGSGLARLDEMIHPLVRQFGWPIKRNRTARSFTLSSPDRSMAIGFDPNRADDWWTVTHQTPRWQATFTRQTPIEAVAAVLRALPQLSGDQRSVKRYGRLTDTSLADLAEQHDWRNRPGEAGVRFASPDGHCIVQQTPDAGNRWVFEHVVLDHADTRWAATFSSSAPEPLVGRFFTNLAGPIPVERFLSEVPPVLREVTTARVTPVRPVRQTSAPSRTAPEPPQSHVAVQRHPRPPVRR